MSNLHAPTVPSGPTTAPVANGNVTQLTIAELQRKKDIIEGELKALGGVLDSHGVDMNTSLLTPDGFPRADIDVAQIRTTRARIIHLRNDWKDLMGVIEKRLHEHFASLEDDDTEEAAPPSIESIPRDSVPERLDQPFAKVNSIVDNSPAAAAGLKPGDLIRNFGYVNIENHDSLKKVAECVQGNEGVGVFNTPPRGKLDKTDVVAAKHPRQGLSEQWGSKASGTPVDTDTTAQLGWQRDAWVPYSATLKAG